MQLYNTISAKAIIGDVMRDFGLDENAYMYDAMEWIGAGIAAIGYHIGLVNKVEVVEVSNNTIQKPCGFYQLNFITHNGLTLRSGRFESRVRNNSSLNNDTYDELVQLVQSRNYSIAVADGAIEIDGCEPCEAGQYKLLNANELERIDNRINHSLTDLALSNGTCQEHYFLPAEGNCYKTSIDNGDKVLIYYKMYPVDRDNYPMVIDEYKYREALSYVVMERLMRRGKAHPTLSHQAIRQERDFNIGRARNEHNKFTSHDMQNFTQKWTSLTFSLYNGSNYFSNG